MDLDCTGSEYGLMTFLFEHRNETLGTKIWHHELP